MKKVVLIAAAACAAVCLGAQDAQRDSRDRAVVWRACQTEKYNGLGCVSLDPLLSEKVVELGGTVVELRADSDADTVRRALALIRDEGVDRFKVCPFRVGLAGAPQAVIAELGGDGLSRPDWIVGHDDDVRGKLEYTGMIPVQGIYPKAYPDKKLVYPERIARKPTLRGVMLPDKWCEEADFVQLEKWGAKLARYQMTLFKPTHTNSNESIRGDYFRWLDERLDHLAEVLPWARRHGIEIVVDLHSYPGGIYKGDEPGGHGAHNAKMFYERFWGEAFAEAWHRIARRFAKEPGIYGFDFCNEVFQTQMATYADYWTMQRRAGEIVRSYNPDATLVMEAVHSDNPWGFEVMCPLNDDNVIYEVHMYAPHEFTHQGLGKAKDEYEHLPYPNEKKGWNKDFLREKLKPVRDFQLRTGARIYCGEFSAIAWAEGAGRYLEDCISLFEEYGWDWTYHAFREFRGWDVEKEVDAYKGDGSEPKRSRDNPRRRALLRGLQGGVSAVLPAVGTTAGMDVGKAVDTRVRTYVYPERIVWQTAASKFDDGWPERAKAEKMEKLLEGKFGQVCEGPFASKSGTKLVNTGEPAGVLLDFGRELHGGVQLGMSPGGTAGARLRLRFGESVAEAMSSIGDGKHASNDHALRDFELPVPVFGSIEVGNTGFRFLRIDLVTGGEVGIEFIRAVSLMRPMKAVGGFRSSDERLNRIFETAVRTAHLCCQNYLWDGIKRDRLVWIGDMHPETMTILNIFGAASILPESLDYMASVTPSDRWMHGMATYTLWWIRNLAEWCRYTGDVEYVRRHADYLEKTFEHVMSGMKYGEWRAGNFLDWPTRHNDKAAWAGTQGLALVTARETAFLADVAGRTELATKARALAAELAKLRPDPNGEKSAAAMLALSGLRDPKEMFAQVLGANGHAGVSTFYGYYMIEAMSAAGESQRALDTVRDYWGAMLDVGATSFWEDFKLSWTNNCFRIDDLPVAGKKDIHGDYGEFCYPGFRHSLCHGWASGPASWCINHVLGIRPLDTGCRRIEVRPFLGDLEWAEGAMALPDGNAVKVTIKKLPDGKVDAKLDAPDWVEVVRE